MATLPSTDPRGAGLRPASAQLPLPHPEILHSANCGLLIHRVGHIRHRFRREAREFGRALQRHVNHALGSLATTLVYDELFGHECRFHWLVHLRAPNDYAHFIHMSDDDDHVRELVQSDRLAHKGGGNWERMFEEGSFRETVMVPQHGIAPAREAAGASASFVPPAHTQTSQPPEQIIDSARAVLIVKRTAQVKFRFREAGRALGHRWAESLNRAYAGDLTALLYEETWGRQDRLHWLIHLRSLDVLERLLHAEPPRTPTDDSAPADANPGADMFVDGSVHDTLLVPHHEGRGLGWP